MPKSNRSNLQLGPIISEFAGRIAAAVERFTTERVARAVDARRALRAVGPKAKTRAARRGRRAPVRCYYPGCKNIAAPRFGMFCAAKHKNLSKAEKDKYRRQHAAR
jgi:hypothetical protein